MTTRSSTSTTIANGSGTAITGAAPSGTTAGDRLLAWIVQDTATTISAPGGEGWTKLADANTTAPADIQTAALFEKKSSSGSETYAFTSTGTQRAIIQVVALSGRHSTTAATVSTPTVNTGANATPVSVTLTGLTAATGDDLLWFGEIDQSNQGDFWSFGSLSGFSVQQNAANGDWISSATFNQDNVSSGATGSLTATATRTSGSGTASWSGLVVAIPAGASGPAVSDPAASSSRFNASQRHSFGIRR